MGAVLCIGDVMLDVITVLLGEINFGGDTPSRISTHGGGAAANVAAWAAQSHAKAHLVARVGRDAAGSTLLTELESLKVDVLASINHDEQTGVVVVLVDKVGERTMFPDTAANAGLTFADLPDLDPFDAIYISGYALLNARSRPGVLQMIRAIREKGLPIFFDPSTVGGMKEAPLGEVRSWLPLMSTLLMNEEEAIFLSGQSDEFSALDSLLALSPNVIIKRGAQGAIGKSRGAAMLSVPALPTTVIDTTGAGDSFAGGYIAAWLNDPEMGNCLQSGSQSAALCVAIVGARPHVTPAL
jgi:sugar/nucleoside kinase (ribokinase family)